MPSAPTRLKATQSAPRPAPFFLLETRLRTLHSHPIRPQLEVVLPPDLPSAGEPLLDIVQVTVDDLLRQAERPVEDLADQSELGGYNLFS